jgi:predicted dehydrogenase
MMGTAVWKIESEDHLTANLQFASGALASIAVVGQRYGGYGQHFDLFGDRAAVGLPWHIVSMDGRHSDALLEKLRREVPDPEEDVRSGWRYLVRRIGWKLGRDWFAPRPVNSHTPIFRAFATALRDDTPAPVTAEEGRAAVELCLAIYQSAITGQAVELPLDAQSPFYAGVPRDEYAKLAASVAR